MLLPVGDLPRCRQMYADPPVLEAMVDLPPPRNDDTLEMDGPNDPFDDLPPPLLDLGPRMDEPNDPFDDLPPPLLDLGPRMDEPNDPFDDIPPPLLVHGPMMDEPIDPFVGDLPPLWQDDAREMDRPDDPFVGELGAFDEPMVLDEFDIENQNPRPRDVGPGHGGPPTYRRVRDASDRGKVSRVYSHQGWGNSNM